MATPSGSRGVVPTKSWTRATAPMDVSSLVHAWMVCVRSELNSRTKTRDTPSVPALRPSCCGDGDAHEDDGERTHDKVEDEGEPLLDAQEHVERAL